MFSRLIAKYDYDIIVKTFMPRMTLGGSTVGCMVGAWGFSQPKYGEVRLGDALFGSIFGSAAGAVLGTTITLLHPLVICLPLALIPYAYNKHKRV